MNIYKNKKQLYCVMFICINTIYSRYNKDISNSIILRKTLSICNEIQIFWTLAYM